MKHYHIERFNLQLAWFFLYGIKYTPKYERSCDIIDRKPSFLHSFDRNNNSQWRQLKRPFRLCSVTPPQIPTRTQTMTSWQSWRTRTRIRIPRLATTNRHRRNGRRRQSLPRQRRKRRTKRTRRRRRRRRALTEYDTYVATVISYGSTTVQYVLIRTVW